MCDLLGIWVVGLPKAQRVKQTTAWKSTSARDLGNAEGADLKFHQDEGRARYTREQNI